MSNRAPLQLGIDLEVFERMDIHVHMPEGAIPKDGPSAGITLATALISALTGRPVYKEVGMTGEITLRGRVLPIGGLREKVLAAHRAGLKVVLVPEKNMKDLVDVPKKVREDLKIIPILAYGPGARSRHRPRSRARTAQAEAQTGRTSAGGRVKGIIASNDLTRYSFLKLFRMISCPKAYRQSCPDHRRFLRIRRRRRPAVCQGRLHRRAGIPPDEPADRTG